MSAPCLMTGKSSGVQQVQVSREWLDERGVRISDTTDLLNNFLGESVSGRMCWFRDVPEVWAALEGK